MEKSITFQFERVFRDVLICISLLINGKVSIFISGVVCFAKQRFVNKSLAYIVYMVEKEFFKEGRQKFNDVQFFKQEILNIFLKQGREQQLREKLSCICLGLKSCGKKHMPLQNTATLISKFQARYSCTQNRGAKMQYL